MINYSMLYQEIERATRAKLATFNIERLLSMSTKTSILRLDHIGHLQDPATLLKRRLWHRCFSVNLAKCPRTPFIGFRRASCSFNSTVFPVIFDITYNFPSGATEVSSKYCATVMLP